jgi:hypothetical protein
VGPVSLGMSRRAVGPLHEIGEVQQPCPSMLTEVLSDRTYKPFADPVRTIVRS